MAFDPDGAIPEGANIFGLPFTEETAKVVLLPVPWDATTSYGGGASRGPAAIKEASRQQDLFDREYGFFWEKAGIYLRPEHGGIQEMNSRARELAKKIIDRAGDSTGLENELGLVNAHSAAVNGFVHRATLDLLESNKIPGILGGDHSVPLGAIKAAAEVHGKIGVLHFDAHHDLRVAYEGFTYSHASIIDNVLKEVPGVEKVVQVGIRDYGKQEFDAADQPRVKVFYDSFLQHRLALGETWNSLAHEIVRDLPEKVWVTFDIDGLDPSLCPGTGTPVPGGLSFYQADYVLRLLAASGRTVVGFDLNEVSPKYVAHGRYDEWDANVGMRLLFRLYLWTLVSRNLVK